MISRKRFIIIRILPIAVLFAFMVSTFIYEHNSIWRWVLFLIQPGLWYLYYRSYRCPHCHRYGLRFHLSDEDAGNCKYCGKLVEWKESQN